MLNTVDVVDIDKIRAITGMPPCPAGVVASADVVDSFHPAEDNINKVITGMSLCPAGVDRSGCYWQLYPAEDNINKVIIGISPWPMDVVELGDW